MPSDLATEFIPLCEPRIGGNEWPYVKECLDTGWVSSVGEYVNRFERTLAEYVGAPHAVATANGTAALHIALLVCGVQPDDEVLVSSMTFIASGNVVRYCSAWPVFVDCDPDYWQMDPARLAEFLETRCRFESGRVINRASGRRVSAILAVDILGHPVDMHAILEIARRYDLKVVEDATESLGASYKGRRLGTLADAACFSFNGNKVITTGGGGMFVTNDDVLARRARHLTTQAKSSPDEYIHDEVGYNYRLTNLQSAVGCAQLEQLDSFIARKLSIAETYRRHLAIPGISWQLEAPWATGIFWLFTILVDEAVFGSGARQLRDRLATLSIQTRCLWQPLHRSPAFVGAESVGGEVADRLFDTSLSLPSSVGLSQAQQERVIAAIVAQ
ncbi:LegC family aminotransferase [soil metagenome]